MNRSTSSSLSVYLSAYLEMSNSMASMKSEDVLFDLLEKHGARPSVSGVDWARQNWYNLQSVSDRIRVLQNEARTRAGKGKSFICAVLGAALKAAVEFREEKNSTETQTIQALQESVKGDARIGKISAKPNNES